MGWRGERRNIRVVLVKEYLSADYKKTSTFEAAARSTTTQPKKKKQEEAR